MDRWTEPKASLSYCSSRTNHPSTMTTTMGQRSSARHRQTRPPERHFAYDIGRCPQCAAVIVHDTGKHLRIHTNVVKMEAIRVYIRQGGNCLTNMQNDGRSANIVQVESRSSPDVSCVCGCRFCWTSGRITRKRWCTRILRFLGFA